MEFFEGFALKSSETNTGGRAFVILFLRAGSCCDTGFFFVLFFSLVACYTIWAYIPTVCDKRSIDFFF